MEIMLLGCYNKALQHTHFVEKTFSKGIILLVYVIYYKILEGIERQLYFPIIFSIESYVKNATFDLKFHHHYIEFVS